MQVDPVKPTLKAPGTKRLTLIYDGPVSISAFTFNLRCYINVAPNTAFVYAFVHVPKVGPARLGFGV